MGNRGPQFQNVLPLTDTVKKLVIANVSIWLVLQVIVEGMILDAPYITYFFSLSPIKVVRDFHIWQPISYMFLHSTNSVWHILFNMLLLWWLGAELELRWGKRFFLTYYLVCGVGAAVLYTIFVFLYSIMTGRVTSLMDAPVVGASGAVFGLMLAYGIVFGERIVYFLFLFAMKAKYMMLLLGAMELVTILNSGVEGGRQVSNLAHVFGIVSGFLFLFSWTRWQRRRASKGKSSSKNRNLKLIVNNEEKDPKYWN